MSLRQDHKRWEVIHFDLNKSIAKLFFGKRSNSIYGQFHTQIFKQLPLDAFQPSHDHMQRSLDTQMTDHWIMEFRENGSSIAWTRWIINIKHVLLSYFCANFVDYIFISSFDLFFLQAKDSTDGVIFIQMALWWFNPLIFQSTDSEESISHQIVSSWDMLHLILEFWQQDTVYQFLNC